MKRLTRLLNYNTDDELFDAILESFRDNITQWSYFVNWKKVHDNIRLVEKELHLLDYLVGKENIEEEARILVREYPQVIKAIPFLLAIREHRVNILTNKDTLSQKLFDFSPRKLSVEEIDDFADFIVKSGLGNVFKNKRIKSVVDYVTGVEVGLDSNGRKNRGGQLMEELVEGYVKIACEAIGCTYLSQANAKKIKAAWDIEILIDKSSRIIDFVINRNGQLYFIETNFYGGGGSKLKSTATEYVKMYDTWKAQNIHFIWVTDGAGWHTTQKPLREYFDKTEYLMNIQMLRHGVLNRLI